MASAMSTSSSMLTAGLVTLAALGAAVVGVAAWEEAKPAAPFECTVVSVYDGDGPIHCRELDAAGRTIRIRLQGIAAREMDGSCRPGHPCPAASAEAARDSLRRLAQGRHLTCHQVGISYERTVAWCARADGIDLSCAQIRAGVAVRWPRYDPEGRLSRC
jgi:endonuclease YncB( thermonuclease family)